MLLMLLGNADVITAVSSLVLSFITREGENRLIVYGRASVERLDERDAGVQGNLEHKRTVEVQRKIQKIEKRKDQT